LEKLSVLLQTEEQSMQESSDPSLNSALAMFVTHNKPSMATMGIKVITTTRGRGGRILSQEAEVEDLQTTPPTSILKLQCTTV
jgi:hypothetical protein